MQTQGESRDLGEEARLFLPRGRERSRDDLGTRRRVPAVGTGQQPQKPRTQHARVDRVSSVGLYLTREVSLGPQGSVHLSAGATPPTLFH